MAALCLLLPIMIGGTQADELSELNDAILNDPQNVDLNLRYARLAEQKGDLRKALAAYERVTVNRPDNPEAQEGFRRVSRKLQPDTTRFTLEVGGGWESNPQRLAEGGESDWLLLLRGEIKDERRLGDAPWRTVATFNGDFYIDQGSEANYAGFGLITGPVTDLTPHIALHTGLGGGSAAFGEHTLYHEGAVNFTLESSFWQGLQTGRLRIGYRSYDEFYGGSDGLYGELSERLGFVSVMTTNDVAVIMPWFRWSGIEGTPLRVPFEETQPGRYWELGLRGEYYRPVTAWITLGGSLSIGYRSYADVTILEDGSTEKRRDWTLIPGLTAIFPRIFEQNADLRLEYRYEDNRSNVEFDTYTDHLFTSSVIFRF
jgi:hypothetical protein